MNFSAIQLTPRSTKTFCGKRTAPRNSKRCEPASNSNPPARSDLAASTNRIESITVFYTIAFSVAPFNGDFKGFHPLEDTLRRLNDPHFVRRHQLQEQIAEWDRRAFLKDARNQGLAEGHKQGFEQGRKEGLEQGLEQGRKEGLEQGRALGEAKGRADVVRQLAASGLLTLEQVAEATGMSEEKVKALTSE